MLQALWMKSANTNIEVEHWIPSQASDQEMHDVGEPQKEASEEKAPEVPAEAPPGIVLSILYIILTQW